MRDFASPEAIVRLGFFTAAPWLYEETISTVFLPAMAAAALWIRKSKRYDLLYLWSVVLAGIVLSRSRMLTGVFFHEYHYNWLWTPLWLALMLIVAASVASMKFRLRPDAASICWPAVMLYFAGGVYLATICVTRTAQGGAELEDYTRYQAQRAAARAAGAPWPRISGYLAVHRSR